MKKTLLSLGIALFLGTSPSTASANDERADCEQRCGAKSRRLKEHTFLFPMLQQSAFVATYFGIREGIARYNIPDVPVADLQPFDVKLTGLQQTLDLSVKLTDWLGVMGFGRATLITGTTPSGLLSSGATLDLMGQIGGIVRLLHSENSGTQLSVRANVGYDRGRQVTLLPFVNAILQTPAITVEEIIGGRISQLLFVPNREVTLNGGIYVAQSLGPMFSLQGSASAEYAWQNRRPFDLELGGRFDQKTHAFRVFLAAAVAVDFYPETHVPLAVMGEFAFRTGHETRARLNDRTLSDSTIGLGIYYSGRSNLQVGIGGTVTLNGDPYIAQDSDGTKTTGNPTLAFGQLILRYIW
ncbi:hypothetical protein [Myxococcus stipitatus]|uniref:hypothetical protein n=1 Tax=Myxococcus stipitatus TaxID=83455 RepID=UPI0030CD1CD2